MDIELRRKLGTMLEALSKLHPSLKAEGKLTWQMTTEMAVNLLKDASLFSDLNTVKLTNDPFVATGVECLGIPVEFILEDEIHLIIKVM